MMSETTIEHVGSYHRYRYWSWWCGNVL